MRQPIVLIPTTLDSSLRSQCNDVEVTMTKRGRGPLFLSILAILMCCGVTAAQSPMTMPTGAPSGSTGQTRRYYIAADEVTWDYVPGGMDAIAGKPFKAVGFFMSGPNPGAKPVEKPVPTSYVKTLYREYTDNTFRILKSRSAEWSIWAFLARSFGLKWETRSKSSSATTAKNPIPYIRMASSTKKTRKARRTMTERQAPTKLTTPCLRAARTSIRGKCQSGLVLDPATSTQ